MKGMMQAPARVSKHYFSALQEDASKIQENDLHTIADLQKVAA